MTSNSRIDVIGRLFETPIEVIAGRATQRVMDTGRDRAICVDPHGIVTVERLSQAIPDEIVITCNRKVGLVEISTLVKENLQDEHDLRMKPRKRQ